MDENEKYETDKYVSMQMLLYLLSHMTNLESMKIFSLTYVTSQIFQN